MVNTNVSENSWVLVYDENAKQVISIVEPGLHTETEFKLMEFSDRDALDKYISDNNLTNAISPV